MAYQTHHCSAAFRCSVCLIAFLHTSLALSVLPLFMLCAPCPFTAQFLFCAIQLLHSPPSSHMNHLHQQQPQQTPIATTTPISSLYRVYIASVHLVHAIFTIPLHAHTTPISSTSRVLCVIIIVTLQLLWPFSHAFSITGCYVEIPQPLWQLRLFVFSVTVELTFSILVTGFHAHPSVNPF
jgi:hypothetical protein